MSENLFVVRIKTPARSQPYFYVRERGEGGKDILALGHDRTVEAAYARCLRDYVKITQRLALFEQVIPHFTPRP
jgi:hypothetical protein